MIFTRSLFSRIATVAAGALICALCITNMIAWHAATDLSRLPAPRRYWEDLSMATANFLAAAQPTGSPRLSINDGRAQDYRRQLQGYVVKTVKAHEIRPWEFWRTIPIEPAFNSGPLRARKNDDPGRSLLLTAAFRLRGGVAPFLPLWLGLLAALPVFAWTIWLFAAAGRRCAALVLLLCCACSPFFVDALALPYSALGFYVLALVVLAGLSVYAFLGSHRSVLSHVATMLVSGVFFSICVLCRGGTLLMLPAFALAVCVAAVRVQRAVTPPIPPSERPLRRWRRWTQPLVAVAASLALFLGPHLATFRPNHHHEIWLGVWEGLGDFDRTKGHAWSDDVVRNVLRQEGIVVSGGDPVWLYPGLTEPVFKKRVIASVRDDPAWYAEILLKRLFVTITQWKLLPYGPQDGISMTPAQHPSQGFVDMYYALTTTADWLGLGRWRAEMPLPLLWSPLLLLPLFALAPSRLTSLAALRDKARASLKVTGCVALGALGLPLAITTASAIETEAFVIVYYLGLAFLLDSLPQATSTDRGPSAPRSLDPSALV